MFETNNQLCSSGNFGVSAIPMFGSKSKNWQPNLRHESVLLKIISVEISYPLAWGATNFVDILSPSLPLSLVVEPDNDIYLVVDDSRSKHIDAGLLNVFPTSCHSLGSWKEWATWIFLYIHRENHDPLEFQFPQAPSPTSVLRCSWMHHGTVAVPLHLDGRKWTAFWDGWTYGSMSGSSGALSNKAHSGGSVWSFPDTAKKQAWITSRNGL